MQSADGTLSLSLSFAGPKQISLSGRVMDNALSAGGGGEALPIKVIARRLASAEAARQGIAIVISATTILTPSNDPRVRLKTEGTFFFFWLLLLLSPSVGGGGGRVFFSLPCVIHYS